MEERSRKNRELVEEISLLRLRIRELEQSLSGCEEEAAALRKSEQKYRLLIESTNEGIVVVQDDRAKFVNRLIEWTGYTKEEYVSLPILQTIHPEDRAVVGERLQQKIDGYREPTRHTYRALDKGGGIHWIDVSSVRIDWDGRPATLNLITDITEGKRVEEALAQSEERNRIFIKQSTTGICLYEWEHPSIDTALPIDEQVDLLYAHVAIRECNQLFAAAHGYRKPEEMTGLRIGQLFPRIAGENIEYLRLFIERGYTISGVETKELTRDGTVKYFLNSILGQVENGRLVRISGAKQDISRIKQTEHRLRVSQGQLRALASQQRQVREEERTRISREIHDQLGGALTGLKIDLFLLKRSALQIDDEALKNSLQEEMESMLRDIDASAQVVHKIAMDLRPGILDDLGIVAAIEWQIKDFEKRTGIRCQFSPPAIETRLDGALSTALFRIFQESLANVARHSGATAVRVRLNVKGEHALLEVADNGRGIGKEEATAARSLGILGMRERVQLFGGRISITGTPGEGTTIRVEIPPEEKRREDREGGDP